MKIQTRFAREKIARQHADLEAEWYAKLAATGFVDIEPYDNPMNTRLISHWHTTMQQVKKGVANGSAELFRLLYEWIDTTSFRSRGERWVLAARCEGFDWNEIAARLAVPAAMRAKTVVNKQLKACLTSHNLKGTRK